MKNPIDALRKILKGNELQNDGSRELAQSWLDLLARNKDMQGLLQNSAFNEILEQLKKDFVSRISELVSADAELRAIKKMFIRSVGLKDAERRIERLVIEFLEEPAEIE